MIRFGLSVSALLCSFLPVFQSGAAEPAAKKPQACPVQRALVKDGGSGQQQTGLASIYTDRRTASGERFRGGELTAAHRTLPFGSRIKVINVRSGLSVVVRINDRGPFRSGRIIDLTPAAASKIGLDKNKGLVQVRIDKTT